jgi:hypothetical protein
MQFRYWVDGLRCSSSSRSRSSRRASSRSRPGFENHAERAFRADRRDARMRERQLHRGLERPVITTRSVHARTTRLRRAGRLPAKSKPLAFQPPADFLDIVADTAPP